MITNQLFKIRRLLDFYYTKFYELGADILIIAVIESTLFLGMTPFSVSNETLSPKSIKNLLF